MTTQFLFKRHNWVHFAHRPSRPWCTVSLNSKFAIDIDNSNFTLQNAKLEGEISILLKIDLVETKCDVWKILKIVCSTYV